LRAQRSNLRYRINAKISNEDRHASRGSARDDPFLETAESLSSFVVPALMGMKVDWVIRKKDDSGSGAPRR
jgi:hypothetical protein